MRFHVLLAALTGGKLCAAQVFTRATSSGLALNVYSDASYSVSVNNTPWLSNSTVGFSYNNEFWGTQQSATPANTCEVLANTDCRGSDLYNFSATDPSMCCTNCTGTAACGAWTYTGTTMDVGGALPPWAYHCYIKSSCSGQQSYSGHTSGTLRKTTQRALQSTGMGPINGSDTDFGPWIGFQASWSTVSTQPVIPFVTLWKLYTLYDFLAFTQVFPQGVPEGSMNISAMVNSTNGPCTGTSLSGRDAVPPLGEFCASGVPSSQFPSFAATQELTQVQGGYVTWSGRFFSSQNGYSAPALGLAATSGVQGGPIVLFAANASTSRMQSLVLAPLDHFKTNIFGPDTYSTSTTGPALAAGVSGYVTGVPAGFSTSVGLYLSQEGITDAMHGWGTVMQKAYDTKRVNDLVVNNLGYATDNGAYYDWYSYSNITAAGVPQDVLIALWDTFTNGTYTWTDASGAAGPIPISYWLIDAYWYHYERPNGNCKLSDDIWSVPFPRGFPYLSTMTGNASLMIYNGPMCGDNTLKRNAPWKQYDSIYWSQGWGQGVFSVVDASQSYDYYTSMMDTFDAGAGTPTVGSARGVQEGKVFPWTFEQDFMDFLFLLFPIFQTNATAFETWLDGMARAAWEHNASLQLCMALPSDMLMSLLLPVVTNARASQDYGAGGNNWQIGGSSLLLSAVGMRASKDNFWTSTRESSPHLVAAAAALSAGPVHFADELLKTDSSVIMPTCAFNGTLLQPSRPATTLDASWVQGSDWQRSAVDVRAAQTDVMACQSQQPGVLAMRAYTVLVAGSGLSSISVPQTLVSSDLWPTPAQSAYMMWQWNSTSCTPGASSAACLYPLTSSSATGAASGLPVGPSHSTAAFMTADATPWSLWSVVPTWTGTGQTRLVLMGEPSKYVPVSTYRFACVSSVQPTGSNTVAVSVLLRGAPGESVAVAYAVLPAGTVQHVLTVMNAQGQGSLVLQA